MLPGSSASSDGSSWGDNGADDGVSDLRPNMMMFGDEGGDAGWPFELSMDQFTEVSGASSDRSDDPESDEAWPFTADHHRPELGGDHQHCQRGHVGEGGEGGSGGGISALRGGARTIKRQRAEEGPPHAPAQLQEQQGRVVGATEASTWAGGDYEEQKRLAFAWVEANNSGGYAKRESMPPLIAQLLLREPSFQPGPRPPVFDPKGGQWVFKEVLDGLGDPAAERRRGNARRTMARDAFAPKADRWHVSGGLKNSRDLPLDRPVVCRRYGTLVPRHISGRGWIFHECHPPRHPTMSCACKCVSLMMRDCGAGMA